MILRISYLALHGIGIDLAHVEALVLPLGAFDAQAPGRVIAVRDGDPGIVSDHVVVDRLDRLCVGLHPAHLSAERHYLYSTATGGARRGLSIEVLGL